MSFKQLDQNRQTGSTRNHAWPSGGPSNVGANYNTPNKRRECAAGSLLMRRTTCQVIRRVAGVTADQLEKWHVLPNLGVQTWIAIPSPCPISAEIACVASISE